MSTKSQNAVVAAVALTLLAVGVLWWNARSEDQAAERFARRLASGEYAEASRLLAEPGSLTMNEMGQLEIVDQNGVLHVVAGTKLPFLVSGPAPPGGPISYTHPSSGAEMISVTALGQSVDGTLTTPAVTLWLHAEDGAVFIDAVEGLALSEKSEER